MKPEIQQRIESLNRMSGAALKAEYTSLFEEVPYSHNRQWLIARISWRLQARDDGGFSQRFLDHGRKNGDLLDSRVTAPACRKMKPVPPKASRAIKGKKRDPRIPAPGTVLARNFKGRHISITVRETGFEWEGTLYASFSKAVKTASQSNYSPYEFFKLGRPKPS